MNIHVILQNLDASALNCIAAELDRYRTAHIVASEANYIVSATDQVNIIRYLRDFSLPGRPQSSEEIMRNFASSALSYHVMRDRLGAHVGGHPTPITITEALAREFDEPRFLESASWEPANLQTLALTVAHLNGMAPCELGGRAPASRILGVLHDGGRELARELERGVTAYYGLIESHLGHA